MHLSTYFFVPVRSLPAILVLSPNSPSCFPVFPASVLGGDNYSGLLAEGC